MPDLQVTVDYWRIRLSNQVIRIPDAQAALHLCYASVGLADRSLATIGARTPVPILNQPTAGGTSSQSLTSLNSGTISTDGIDYGVYCWHRLASDGGKLPVTDVATTTMSFLAAGQSGSINNPLGRIQQTSSPFTSANPRFQSQLTAGWSNDSWSVSWSTPISRRGFGY